MSKPERTLFDLPDVTPSLNEKPVIHRRQGDLTEIEERRRKMAEDRLGEAVVKVPNIGYVALSSLHEYQPVADIETT